MQPNINEWKYLQFSMKIISNINKENITQAAQAVIDNNYIESFNIIISQMIYSSFVARLNDFNIYLDFIKEIEKLEESNKYKFQIFNIFVQTILNKKSQESYYFLYNMIEKNLIDSKITKSIKSKYFAHYKTEEESKHKYYDNFCHNFLENYDKLSKDNWKLHKQLIEDGHNPIEIAKIIRNDEIEKLQEISSQSNFDFNQTIEQSLYEICSFINQENVTLIDYAAFFSSVKCFKYLLMNGANVYKTGKYAVAGGNEEIIHLCEQNHSSFEGAYETAIEFHRNDIFKYIYENKLEELNSFIESLSIKCILYHDYEILSFLQDRGLTINDGIFNEAARIGNLFLVKYFQKFNQLPKDILVFSIESGNIELVRYILEQKSIDINERNILLIYFCMF